MRIFKFQVVCTGQINFMSVANLPVDVYFMVVLETTLRHCATNRKVAGSIPDGVAGIFQ